MIAAVPSSFRPLDGRLLIGTSVAVRRLSLLGPANKLPFPESLSEGSVLVTEPCMRRFTLLSFGCVLLFAVPAHALPPAFLFLWGSAGSGVGQRLIEEVKQLRQQLAQVEAAEAEEAANEASVPQPHPLDARGS